jgi:hypothetical protein
MFTLVIYFKVFGSEESYHLRNSSVIVHRNNIRDYRTYWQEHNFCRFSPYVSSTKEKTEENLCLVYDSSVGIVMGYGLDGPGYDFRKRQTDAGASYPVGTVGSSPGVRAGGA